MHPLGYANTLVTFTLHQSTPLNKFSQPLGSYEIAGILLEWCGTGRRGSVERLGERDDYVWQR